MKIDSRCVCARLTQGDHEPIIDASYICSIFFFNKQNARVLLHQHTSREVQQHKNFISKCDALMNKTPTHGTAKAVEDTPAVAAVFMNSNELKVARK